LSELLEGSAYLDHVLLAHESTDLGAEEVHLGVESHQRLLEALQEQSHLLLVQGRDKVLASALVPHFYHSDHFAIALDGVVEDVCVVLVGDRLHLFAPFIPHLPLHVVPKQASLLLGMRVLLDKGFGFILIGATEVFLGVLGSELQHVPHLHKLLNERIRVVKVVDEIVSELVEEGQFSVNELLRAVFLVKDEDRQHVGSLQLLRPIEEDLLQEVAQEPRLLHLSSHLLPFLLGFSLLVLTFDLLDVPFYGLFLDTRLLESAKVRSQGVSSPPKDAYSH